MIKRLESARWWRFSGYHIHDGRICPAPDAELQEFNPWESWMNFINDTGTSKRNLLCAAPLVEIVKELGYDVVDPAHRADPGNLSQKQTRAILDWVNQNGLLGLIPHRVEYVRLAARWRSGSLVIFADESGAPESIPCATSPMHQWYARGPHDWNDGYSSARCAESDLIFPADHPRLNGQLLPFAQLKKESRGGMVVIRNLYNVARYPRVRFETLGETWAHYFRLGPGESTETYQYPKPLTEAFWRIYAEPVDEFLRASALLASAIEMLADRHGRKVAPGLAHSEASELSSLAAPVQPSIVVDRYGGVRLSWAVPSLLSGLAMITILQLGEIEGQTLGLCGRCGLPFVTRDKRGKYCGRKCRMAMQKRAWRKKHEGLK